MKTNTSHLGRRMLGAVVRLCRGIREWCGDAAYDRYLKSNAKHACGVRLLSREQFYLEQLHRRYSRVSRCC